MDLFSDHLTNLLPEDGIVNYYGKVLSNQESDYYFNCLLKTVVWKNDEALIFGKRIVTRRKAAWYGDSDFEYTYSGTTKRALPWTGELIQLKTLAEEKTGEKFNSKNKLNLQNNC
jgi:hypothetical protein